MISETIPHLSLLAMITTFFAEEEQFQDADYSRFEFVDEVREGWGGGVRDLL